MRKRRSQRLRRTFQQPLALPASCLGAPRRGASRSRRPPILRDGRLRALLRMRTELTDSYPGTQSKSLRQLLQQKRAQHRLVRHRQQVVGVVDDLERGAWDLLGEECRNALSGNPAATARYQANGTCQRAQCLRSRIGEGHLEVEDDLLCASANL